MSNLINQLAALIAEDVDHTWYMLDEAIKPVANKDFEFADDAPYYALADYWEEEGGTINDLARMIYGIRAELVQAINTIPRGYSMRHMLSHDFYGNFNIFKHIVHAIRHPRSKTEPMVVLNTAIRKVETVTGWLRSWHSNSNAWSDQDDHDSLPGTTSARSFIEPVLQAFEAALYKLRQIGEWFIHRIWNVPDKPTVYRRPKLRYGTD